MVPIASRSRCRPGGEAAREREEQGCIDHFWVSADPGGTVLLIARGRTWWGLHGEEDMDAAPSSFLLNHSDAGGYCTVDLPPFLRYCRNEELLLSRMHDLSHRVRSVGPQDEGKPIEIVEIAGRAAGDRRGKVAVTGRVVVDRKGEGGTTK